MEIAKRLFEASQPNAAGAWPANDNRNVSLAMGRSLFPADTIAHIYRPARSVMTSGRMRTSNWRLVFEPRSPSFIEPLMGYTGNTDTLPQVELEFPTLEAAVRYAERQGLTYFVQKPAEAADEDDRPAQISSRACSSATLDQPQPGAGQEGSSQLQATAANHDELADLEAWDTPAAVVRDPVLPLEVKRSILMNWSWTEYLVDLATNEGMPENNRPSRFDEVEQALLALERHAEPGCSQPPMSTV